MTLPSVVCALRRAGLRSSVAGIFHVEPTATGSSGRTKAPPAEEVLSIRVAAVSTCLRSGSQDKPSHWPRRSTPSLATRCRQGFDEIILGTGFSQFDLFEPAFDTSSSLGDLMHMFAQQDGEGHAGTVTELRTLFGFDRLARSHGLRLSRSTCIGASPDVEARRSGSAIIIMSAAIQRKI